MAAHGADGGGTVGGAAWARDVQEGGLAQSQGPIGRGLDAQGPGWGDGVHRRHGGPAALKGLESSEIVRKHLALCTAKKLALGG